MPNQLVQRTCCFSFNFWTRTPLAEISIPSFSFILLFLLIPLCIGVWEIPDIIISYIIRFNEAGRRKNNTIQRNKTGNLQSVHWHWMRRREILQSEGQKCQVHWGESGYHFPIGQCPHFCQSHCEYQSGEGKSRKNCPGSHWLQIQKPKVDRLNGG